MATTSIEHYVSLYRVGVGQNTHVLLQGFGVPSETPLLGTSYPGPGMGLSDGWPGYNLDHAMPEDFVIAGTQVLAEGSNNESITMSMEWTPRRLTEKSKLGRHELEVPVETGPPGLGFSRSYAMGPTPMGSASGNPGQAWEEGGGSLRGSMESPQDEAEMLARLMVRVKGSWRCAGCNGKEFYDRSTLKRHCRSRHSNNPGMKDCPYCDKSYSRQYGVNRHIKKKHGQSGVGEGSTIQ
jgi:Zinc finger, C2H2 type